MASRKNRPLWIDEVKQQATSGTPYANKREEREAQNTPTQRAVHAVARGTGSQTTSTGRTGTAQNGVQVLQAAQAALNKNNSPYAPVTVPKIPQAGQTPTLPDALKPGTGKVMTPQARLALAGDVEKRRKEHNEQAADKAFGNDALGKEMRQELKTRKESESVTLGDFLSDPLYAASAKLGALGYDIQGVGRMLFNSEKHKEHEARRAAYNEAMEAPEKPNTTTALQGMVEKGGDQFASGYAGLANLVLGAPFRAAGAEDNPFSRFNEAVQATQEADRIGYAKNMEHAGTVAKKAEEIGTQAVAAVPDMVLAYLTAGSSVAGRGAMAGGASRLAGREAALAGAESTSKLAGKTALARQVGRSSARNPQYWTAFAQSSGHSYNEAKASGATDWEASMYALINGTLNAQVEVGSGMQTLPAELQKGGSALLAYLRSAAEEGNEEVVQGAVERALQNLTYGAGNPLFPTKSKESGTRSQITPDILSKSNRSELEKLGAGGNVDLATRPVIDSKLLGDAGWDAGGGLATIYTSTFTDESERTAMNFTPIAVNGNGAVIKILSPRELQKYAEGVIAGTQDDYLHLKVGATFYGNDAISQAEKAAERIHEIHETAVYGNDGRTAIFDPVTAAKEWGSGAAVSAILGAPGSVRQGVQNVRADRDAVPAAAEEAARQRRIAAADAARARHDALFGTDAETLADMQARQNRAESPVANGTSQAGNLPGTAETAPTQSETGQNEAEERIATPQAARNDNAGETFAPEDHIDNRTDDYIAKRSTKPFQHEHPELHDNFVAVAREMQALLNASVESDHPGKKGGTVAWYPEAIRKLTESTGVSRPKLMSVLQDIIDNHGSEDYATAKRVEKVLDELLTKGYEGYGRRRVPPDDNYLAKKDKINGAFDRNSFKAFMDENWMRTLEGDTEEQLKAEWEALQAQRAAEASEAGANVPQTVPADANGLPEGQGAMSPQFAYEEAPTQTHGSDALYNEEERQTEGLRPEDSTHKVNSDAEVDRNAQERLEFDYDGEKADLFETKQSWDDADTALAHRIMEAEIAQARMTGDYSEVVRLQRVWEAHGTEQGQALRQRGRFTHSAADIVGEAAETLLGDGADTRGDQEAAKQKLDEIAQFADEWESISPNDTENMLALIRRLNAARRTGGFFSGRNMSRTLENTINAVAQQEGGAQFLRDIAEAQLRGLSADHARLSPLEAIKSVRYLSMLSKLNTTMRNLVGNTAFDITETVSNNIATPLDMFLSLRTGRRTTANDASWLSSAKRQGAKEAAQRAYIETALDVDLGDTSNRFEQRTGRTFKMDSNPVERFLSTMEKWQRYMLTVTDEFAKGGTRAEQQRGIDRLTERGSLEEGALDGWAEETARERTFQNDGRISSALRSLRDAGNALSFRDRRGGSFGLGDAILPFAQVPGNIAGQFFNYSPLGLAKGTAEVLGVLKAGKNATAEQQARAVRNVGRGLNGTALTGIFVYLAAKGLLKVAGDDDKDKAALERDEGMSGTQLNIDAALRAMRGESAEWRDGDDLMSIGFLEPFNGNMAMGYLISEAYRDAKKDGKRPDGLDHLYNVADANVEAGLQAVMDLPAMSTLKNIGDAFEYSTADTTAGRVADAGVQFAGDTAASFVPNAVAGIAQGMDNGIVRVTRTSDKRGAAASAENALNSIRSKIPGLRDDLPQALDSWGRGRQTTATPLQNWFNANILPGSITQYDTNPVNQELRRLMETQDVKAPARNPVKEVQAGDEKKQLSTDEQRTYQQNAGQTAFRELQNLMNAAQYRSMTDAERAAAWDAIMSFGKAKGAQAVGGSAETPKWTEYGDGSTAQKAAFHGILQAAKQTISKDERGKNGAQMQAVLNRRLSDADTMQVFAQILGDSSTLGKVQELQGNKYDLETIVGYYNAANEEGEFWNPDKKKYTKKRSKSAMIQYMMENYGLSNAQATYMYYVFNPKQS